MIVNREIKVWMNEPYVWDRYSKESIKMSAKCSVYQMVWLWTDKQIRGMICQQREVEKRANGMMKDKEWKLGNETELKLLIDDL